MTKFESLIARTPVVLILDEVDPYCHKVLDIVNGLNIEQERLTLFYVDKEENGKEITTEAEATLPVPTEDKNLPYLYLGGKLFYNGQNLAKLPRKTAFRNKLAAVEAITLPALAKAKELIASNVLVVFLTNYSPFCQAGKEVISTYTKLTDKKLELVFVDKRTDGNDLLEAAFFLSDTENTPVIFLGNEPFGTFKQFTDCHENFELYDRFAEKGLIPAIPHEELRKMKESTAILLIGNEFSPYSLNLIERFQNLQLPSGALRVEKEKQSLEIAALIDNKTREGPYIYIKGEHISFDTINGMDDTALLSFLKTKGVL